ncbi:MAG: peptidylprolyl isomerase, partial [Ulvibacter sp.]|nr:peptidylprolyl isomerase [Ulvibacter sp.]
MKCIPKNSIAILLLLSAQTFMVAQQVVAVDSTGVAKENPLLEAPSQLKQNDSVLPFKRYKAEGVSAVIGGYVVLDSDIDKSYLEFKQNGVSVEDITRCELLGKLMEDKLYLHQAKQDSITISDA